MNNYITKHGLTQGTARKRHRTMTTTRQHEYNLSKAISTVFLCEIIGKLERTLIIITLQNMDQPKAPQGRGAEHRHPHDSMSTIKVKQLSLPQRDNCQTRKGINNYITKQGSVHGTARKRHITQTSTRQHECY